MNMNHHHHVVIVENQDECKGIGKPMAIFWACIVTTMAMVAIVCSLIAQ